MDTLGFETEILFIIQTRLFHIYIFHAVIHVFFSYIKSLSRLTLTEDRVAKVVPQRIFSVAIHPSMDKVITACGDKWGRLGLWFVVSSYIWG